MMVNNYCRASRLERSGSTGDITIDDADFTFDVNLGLGDVTGLRGSLLVESGMCDD